MLSLRRWTVSASALVAAVIALALIGQARAGEVPALKGAMLGDGTDLYLEVFMNGRAVGLIAAFKLMPDGRLTIAPDELAEIGLKADAAATCDDGSIDITRLQGVTASYDVAGQRVMLTAPDAARLPRRIEARPALAEAEVSPVEPGAVVNYTVYASGGRDESWRFEGVSALLEGRAFGPWGRLSGAVLARSDAERGRWRRLNTTWRWSDPSGPTTYAAGDVISGGLSWTRPVRLGGVQIRRNFGLRPDIVTQPMAALRGSADVPSTVEVYVDGARQFAADVDAGPFEVTNLPLVSGGGTARVVVRDALGRATVTETPFYATNTLLAEGRCDFSAELGVARRDFGSEQDSYDNRLFASGSLRYGVSDALTFEGHGEAGGGLIMGGAGFAARLGSLGAVSLAAAASRYDGATGTSVQARLEMDIEGARIFALSQRSSPGFADIASVTAVEGNASAPRAVDQVAVSFPEMWGDGSMTLSYTRLDRADMPEAQIVSANISQEVPGDAMIYLSAFADLSDEEAYGVFVGASMPLGPEMTLGGNLVVDAARVSAAAEIIQAETGEPGGYGWRVRVGDDVQAVRGTYRSEIARLEGSVWHGADGVHATAQAEGALVLTGSGLFASPRVDDAFVVVETGVPGVEVQLENRFAGRTDSDGQLLVPGLRAYEVNRVSIDPGGLPAGADMAEVVREVTPADGAGTLLDFAVKATPASALVTLRDETGAFVEPGATAVLAATGESFAVGYEGQVYVQGLGAENRLRVQRLSGALCSAVFAFSRAGTGQVKLGDVVCVAGAGTS